MKLTEQSNTWIERTKVVIAEIEATMKSKNVPFLRGYVRDEERMVLIDVRVLDAKTLAVVPDGNSLCVVEFDEPNLPLTSVEEVDDLHVYLRMGATDTWIHYGSRVPGKDSDNDIEAEPSWPFGQRALTIDSNRVNELAMVVARAPGFCSLRNGQERQDFVNATCNEDAELNTHDVWEIAKMAESCFTLGVAPTLAKALENEGKSIAQIAKALGLSKVRTERALATTTPAHISKLLK